MNLPIGTSLKVFCPGKGVNHYGILSYEDMVIDNAPRNGIALRTWEEFSEGEQVYYLPKENDDLPEEIVHKRALSRIGEKSYSAISSNCEHFMNWCKKGKPKSAQVKKISADAIAFLAVFIACMVIIAMIIRQSRKRT